MKWLYFFLIFTLPFGQLQKIPISLKQFTEVNLYLTDLISLAILIFWLVKLIKKQTKPPQNTKYFFLFFIIAAIPLFLNISWLGTRNILVSSLYLIRLIAYSSIYFAFPLLKLSTKKTQKIFQFLYWAGALVAIFGLLQYIFYPDIRPLSSYGWDLHLYRVVSTFLDPGFTGLILVLSLIIALENSLHYRRKALNILPAIIIYLALILTYSRSSYLALILATAFIFFSQKKPRFFWLFLIFFLTSIFLAPRPAGEGIKLERISTIEARLQSYQRGINIFLKKPILGIGFNSYRYAQNKFFPDINKTLTNRAGSSPDSSLILVLATTGTVGLAVFGLMASKIISPLLKKSKEPANNLILASLIAISIHSFFLNSLFYPAVMIWFFLLLGVEEIIAGNKL